MLFGVGVIIELVATNMAPNIVLIERVALHKLQLLTINSQVVKHLNNNTFQGN